MYHWLHHEKRVDPSETGKHKTYFGTIHHLYQMSYPIELGHILVQLML